MREIVGEGVLFYIEISMMSVTEQGVKFIEPQYGEEIWRTGAAYHQEVFFNIPDEGVGILLRREWSSPAESEERTLDIYITEKSSLKALKRAFEEAVALNEDEGYKLGKIEIVLTDEQRRLKKLSELQERVEKAFQYIRAEI